MSKETVASLSVRLNSFEELMLQNTSILQALANKGGVMPTEIRSPEPVKVGEIKTPTLFQSHEVTTEVASMIRKQGGHVIWVQDNDAGKVNAKGSWETTHGLFGSKYVRKDGTQGENWINLPNSDLSISPFVIGKRLGDDPQRLQNQSALEAIQRKMAEIDDLRKTMGIS
jgi:hypothetical protein|tara:strand:+ start:198 stop:707 length:510 start_codon:yes stop_codon:yes gene_type:complete